MAIAFNMASLKGGTPFFMASSSISASSSKYPCAIRFRIPIISSHGMSGKFESRKSGASLLIRFIPSPIAVINVQFAANNCIPPGDE